MAFLIVNAVAVKSAAVWKLATRRFITAGGTLRHRLILDARPRPVELKLEQYGSSCGKCSSPFYFTMSDGFAVNSNGSLKVLTRTGT